MKLPALVFGFCLLSSLHTWAQYGDAYHKADAEKINKDQKAYTDAYIDALRYNRNAKTTGSQANAGNGADAAQQLADIFAARAGRETSSQKAARVKAEQEAYDTYVARKAADHESYMAAARDDEARENYFLVPKINMYKAAGFEPFEAKILGQSHVRSKLSPDKQIHIYYEVFPHRSVVAMEAFKSFNTNFNTATFEDLFDLIFDFNVAPYSALLAVKKMETRFPEKKELLKASYLLHTASFWGSANDNTYNAPCAYADANVKKMMFDIFYEAFLLYPKGAELVAVKSHPMFNPLKLIADSRLEQKKYKEAFLIARQFLLAPAAEGSNDQDKKESIQAFNRHIGNAKLKKTERLSTDDVKTSAANYDITTTRLIEYLTDAEAVYSTARLYYGKYYFPVTPLFEQGDYENILKELGEKGDAGALNTYAVGVAFGKFGKSPSSAMEMWMKAADAGSSYAITNMCMASKWGLKWYTAEHLALAKQKLKTFKPGTKQDEYILIGNTDNLRDFRK